MVQKGDVKVYLPPTILIGTICVLTILEPDLGSTSLMALLTAIMFFVAGIRLRYIIGVLLSLAGMLYALILMKPYRISRLQAYLNPWQDPQGSGFQIIQSFLALRSAVSAGRTWAKYAEAVLPAVEPQRFHPRRDC